MQEPLVSIIMGIYNCEKTLSKCIDSILKQTYTNWELIMCDDCSTDETLQLAMGYAERYPNIYVIHNNTNKKLAYSLNRCLELSKGEFIARMDADDICLPERLFQEVDILKKNQEFDVVGSAIKIFDENGLTGERAFQEYPSEHILLTTTPFSHPTILMRKEVYDSLEGYTVSKETSRGQDLDLWFRFYAKGYRGYNIQTPLLLYHESRYDFKKRNIKASIGYAKIFIKGYRLLNWPKYKYLFALRPIIVALVPKNIRYIYRHKKSNLCH